MKISLRLDTIAENYQAVMPMIREAIGLRDDLALGYRSPGEYVADRFGQALSALGVELRGAVVGELTQAGLSTRAIAEVVGVSKSQVAIDRRQVSSAGHLAESPESAVVRSESVNRGIAYVQQQRETERRSVTGIDGKTYRAPVRQAQRDDAEVLLNLVRSLADQAARQAEKLTPAQIARVKPKADHWTAGLRDSLEVLRHLLTSLTEEK